MKKIIINLFFVFISCAAMAQDPLFSQYYQAPLFMNAGFTGLTERQRFVINHRLQWPGLPQAFSTYAASYDMYIPQVSSGIGVMFTSDKMGSVNWKTTTASVLYSYKIRLNEALVFSPGISFGYGTNGLDRSRLKMSDVMIQGGGSTLDPEINKIQNSNYMDFGSGFLLYSERLWIGTSFSHMNRPQLSLLGENDRLDMRTSVHAGIKIELSSPMRSARPVYFTPSFIYQMQGKNFSQFDAGVNFHIDPVSIGAWYRGKPFSKNENNVIDHDALILFGGLYLKNFNVGYSYDFTISSLGPGTGGAHEISITYELRAKKRTPNKNKLIPCPAFYGRR
ncbi:MAG TPA: type IX secretion system membrane protein PorP/SprF [Ohtaekwangia sp.]|nr:type IX secretion system membrane protein PorP/SprF [Ohtaekwangia sp.]